MVLLTQLLRGELIQVDHLTRQVTTLLEPLTEQDDLGNQSVIGDHHGYRSEQGLQIVR